MYDGFACRRNWILLIFHQRNQIATQLVIRELTKRGIGVDSLEVEKLGVRGVTLKTVRLRLPNGWIVSLDGVNASYSRDSIGDRELESVEIERARFAQPQTAAPSTGPQTNSLSLPFVVLEILFAVWSCHSSRQTTKLP